MFRRAALALLAVLMIEPAAAANEQFHGVWSCDWVNRTVSRNRFENWMWKFTMTLNADGTMSAQGYYYAETNGYNDPFSAQGRWQTDGTRFAADAQARLQTGGARQFGLYAEHKIAGSMTYEYSSANGKMLLGCQKQGN